MLRITFFIAVVFIGILTNRALAWGRRADAAHRDRFRSWGFLENFPSYRLRADQYSRIALISWVIFAGLPTLFTPTPSHYRFVLLRVVSTEAIYMVMAVIPAIVVWAAVRTYKERTLPDGMHAALILAKQFHAPVLTLEPDGSYGTARMLTPAEIGLINLQGMQTRGFRPIMTEVKK